MASLDQLNKKIKNLGNVIRKFPQGARTLKDFRPIERKIQDLRYELRALKTRILVCQARTDMISASVERSSKEDLQHSLENLHSSLSHFIVNRNCFENALINKTIARIKAREMGSEDVAVKVDKLLKLLLTINESNISTTERRRVLVNKKLQLKLEYREQVFIHQQFLEAQRSRETRELETTNPAALNNKERILRLIHKINYMKKLITNMIAGVDEKMVKNNNFYSLLLKHKKQVTRKTIEDVIKEIESCQDLSKS